MFTKTSRYYGLPTVAVTDDHGQTATAVKLRELPATPGAPTMIKNGDQLDVLSERRYRDGAKFWHIADANTELEANALTVKEGRMVKLP